MSMAAPSKTPKAARSSKRAAKPDVIATPTTTASTTTLATSTLATSTLSTSTLATSIPASTSPAPGATTRSITPNAGYDVARALNKCHECQRELLAGERFMAALRETPLGFERVDVCPACWESYDRKDVLAFWQAVLPQHEVKKKLFVDDTVLCELFERLADASEAAKVNFRFVLGLILMRKRLLVYENTHTDGSRELWCVRIRGREEILDLLNPRLDESQVQEVSQQLSSILSEETSV